MALSPQGTPDRREAAVAAALAGAVVVVLGYASGLGLETASQVVAVQQPPAVEAKHADPVAQPSEHAVPATGAVGGAHHTTGHVGHRAHDVVPSVHDHTPTAPTSPAPSGPSEPEPEPEPSTPDCVEAVLPALPLLTDLTHAVSSLLAEVVGEDLGCAAGEILDPTGAAR